MINPSRYLEGNEKFYKLSAPKAFPKAKVLLLNEQLALELGLSDFEQLKNVLLLRDKLHPTIALAYAGHQFGHLVPQLGDGRAHLLGEIHAPNGLNYDLQMKGSGRTPFSRGGDGLSPLGPALREFLISESMAYLRIPSTRSLGVVKTEETVMRETEAPGGIVSRVARAHIRVGTFEFFAIREDFEGLKDLAEFTRRRLYPDCADHVRMYESILSAQAKLIASWMSVGFIHGVMNTDNMSLAGETIDFGPCAFMDQYQAEQVYSSIDRHGRYAYNNQPQIAQWNLSVLAGCLALISSEEQIKELQLALDSWQSRYQNELRKIYATKFGLENYENLEIGFVHKWLWLLEKYDLDFTLAHRNLSRQLDPSDSTASLPTEQEFQEWVSQWKALLKKENRSIQIVEFEMNTTNPLVIPRNHLVERALEEANEGDMTFFEKLWKAIQTPYQSSPEIQDFIGPPKESEKIEATFCGT